MTLWLDAQLSPALAAWISSHFKIQAMALRDLGLRDAEDREIFLAARKADAIVFTKDSDFVDLLEQLGPPPKVIWLTCGNTSNANLETILQTTLVPAMECLQQGDSLVEITEKQ